MEVYVLEVLNIFGQELQKRKSRKNVKIYSTLCLIYPPAIPAGLKWPIRHWLSCPKKYLKPFSWFNKLHLMQLVEPRKRF